MRVTIRLFARLRELAATGELERQVAEGSTARATWDTLTAEFPAQTETEPSLASSSDEGAASESET